LLELKRNDADGVIPAIKLVDYYKSQNNYKVLSGFDGRPSKMLKKLIQYYLDKEILTDPHKTLYEINKMFIDSKKVSSIAVGDMGIKADIEKLLSGLKVMFYGKK